MFGGGACPINADFLCPRLFETTNSFSFVRSIAAAEITPFLLLKVDSQDIPSIPCITEKRSPSDRNGNSELENRLLNACAA